MGCYEQSHSSIRMGIAKRDKDLVQNRYAAMEGKFSKEHAKLMDDHKRLAQSLSQQQEKQRWAASKDAATFAEVMPARLLASAPMGC